MNDGWLDSSLYPFASHDVRLPAGRMHYIDEGAGPAVVMVHGNPTWSFLFRRLVVHLRTRFRCVAPDHLGFGLSDKPGGWNYHPREHATNFAALVDHLALDRLTLVVHDWGGPIGLSYALDYPDRISGIVVLNSWMWPVDKEPRFVAFGKLVGGPVGRFLTRRFNFFVRVVMKKVYADPTRLTDDIHKHYLAPLGTAEERRGCAAFPGQIVGATDWLAALWRRRAVLENIPMQLAWGMKDIAFRPRELTRWREFFPAAEVAEFPDVGHFVPEEAPDRLNAVVERFLVAANTREQTGPEAPHP